MARSCFWVPHAMLANRELEWRELDARTVEVRTPVGGTRVGVRLEFDAEGDIVGTSAERPRAEENGVQRPWIGKWSDYAVVSGIRLPTRGAVRWDLPHGAFTYWRGTITSAEWV